MKSSWLILSVILICAAPRTAGAQVIPTSEWINLWSDASTLNRNPLPVDATVRVYDPDGVLCGESQVNSAGSYGLVPVYRDDPLTQHIDEGAEPGDTLQVTIDGSPARTTGPDIPVWTQNGDVLRVDLAAERVIATSEWVSFWSDSTSVGDEPVVPGAVIRAYDPDGVLCGEFTVVATGSYGLVPVYGDDPQTVDFDEGANPGDTLSFTIDGAETSALGPDIPVWSANGHVLNVNLRVEPVSTFLVSARVWTTDDVVELEWSLAHPVELRQLTLSRWNKDDMSLEELWGVSIHRDGSDYRATDDGVIAGVTYDYRLRIELSDGAQVLELGSARIDPPSFDLLPSSPNPFRYGTTIRFDLDEPSSVTIGTYDATGRLVRLLLDGRPYPAGRHEVMWDGLDRSGSAVPAGVYFIRVQAGGLPKTGKITLLR